MTAEQPPIRSEIDNQGSERHLLTQFLTYARDTIALKVHGLPADGWIVPVPVESDNPHPMTLVGLIKHLWFVEDYWTQDVLIGGHPLPPWDDVDWSADGDWDWNSAACDDPAAVVASWQQACRRTDQALAASGLDAVAAVARSGEDPVSVRWLYLHLIEEYFRHAGHADLLRENIDGSRGD